MDDRDELRMYVCVYIYRVTPPPPQDLPGDLLKVSRSISEDQR